MSMALLNRCILTVNFTSWLLEPSTQRWMRKVKGSNHSWWKSSLFIHFSDSEKVRGIQIKQQIDF